MSNSECNKLPFDYKIKCICVLSHRDGLVELAIRIGNTTHVYVVLHEVVSSMYTLCVADKQALFIKIRQF